MRLRRKKRNASQPNHEDQGLSQEDLVIKNEQTLETRCPLWNNGYPLSNKWYARGITRLMSSRLSSGSTRICETAMPRKLRTSHRTLYSTSKVDLILRTIRMARKTPIQRSKRKIALLREATTALPSLQAAEGKPLRLKVWGVCRQD